MDLTSAILDSVKNGYPIVVVNDKDRENEGVTAGMLSLVPERGLVRCTISDILALAAQIQPKLPRSATTLVKAKIISSTPLVIKTQR